MRHRARLIHPQPVTIEPYDSDGRPQDSLRGRSAPTVTYSTSFDVDAQVEFGTHKDRSRRGQDGKPTISSIGVAFIRTTDAAKNQYTPRKGDRITFKTTNILGVTLVWVDKAEPTGKTRTDYSLWKLTLSDRSPGRNSEP